MYDEPDWGIITSDITPTSNQDIDKVAFNFNY